MENQSKLLEELYYSLKSPVSFASVEKLYKAAKQKDESISRKYVENWLSSQLTYTLHKPVKLNFKTRPVLVYDIDE